MMNEKNKKQSMDDRRMQKATIIISELPGDDDDELLEMMYQMIKTERERGRSMQTGFFTDNMPKTSQ